VLCKFHTLRQQVERD
jgi:5-methyltetrahydrofolate--homocysteine methyltransferase